MNYDYHKKILKKILMTQIILFVAAIVLDDGLLWGQSFSVTFSRTYVKIYSYGFYHLILTVFMILLMGVYIRYIQLNNCMK